MRDAGASKHPPSFKGEGDNIQPIRNIVHNIADNYWGLSIPEGYASPRILLAALLGLRNLTDRQLAEIEQIEQGDLVWQADAGTLLRERGCAPVRVWKWCFRLPGGKSTG